MHGVQYHVELGPRSESSDHSPHEQYIHHMNNSFTRSTDQGMDRSLVYQIINFQITDWTVSSLNKLVAFPCWFTK